MDNGQCGQWTIDTVQIHRLLGSIDDPLRKMKWQQIQGEVRPAPAHTSVHTPAHTPASTQCPCSCQYYSVPLLPLAPSSLAPDHPRQVAQEYDVVKNIMQTLNQFKVQQESQSLTQAT